MASSTLSNYASNKIMGSLLRGETWTPDTTLYLALFITAPELDGSGGNEVSTNGTNYARVALPCNTTTWTAPTGANLEYSNNNEISFGIPDSVSWGTIKALGLYNAATGGQLIFVSTIGTAKPVQSGDGAPRILPKQLRISRAVCG